MGLDTTHDCWHGAYGGFREFREKVGIAAGLPYRIITDEERYDKGQRTLDIDWDRYPAEALYGRWRKVRPSWIRKGDVYGTPVYDDVLYLLVHSDCDGELRLGYLPRLKARLEQLEPAYENITSDWDQSRLRQFINGLELAIEQREHVRFH